MMEVIISSKTSVLKKATRRNPPMYDILPVEAYVRDNKFDGSFLSAVTDNIERVAGESRYFLCSLPIAAYVPELVKEMYRES
jgi:hypothetical protein